MPPELVPNPASQTSPPPLTPPVPPAPKADPEQLLGDVTPPVPPSPKADDKRDPWLVKSGFDYKDSDAFVTAHKALLTKLTSDNAVPETYDLKLPVDLAMSEDAVAALQTSMREAKIPARLGQAVVTLFEKHGAPALQVARRQIEELTLAGKWGMDLTKDDGKNALKARTLKIAVWAKAQPQFAPETILQLGRSAGGVLYLEQLMEASTFNDQTIRGGGDQAPGGAKSYYTKADIDAMMADPRYGQFSQKYDAEYTRKVGAVVSSLKDGENYFRDGKKT